MVTNFLNSVQFLKINLLYLSCDVSKLLLYFPSIILCTYIFFHTRCWSWTRENEITNCMCGYSSSPGSPQQLRVKLIHHLSLPPFFRNQNSYCRKVECSFVLIITFDESSFLSLDVASGLFDNLGRSWNGIKSWLTILPCRTRSEICGWTLLLDI